MERRGVEIKVGIFVLIAIAVTAVMVIKFSKSGRGAKDSFPVTVRFDEVGGIIHGSSVFYQGVYVGHVSSIRLNEVTNKVDITVLLLKDTRIPSNAKFEIRQVGFLGDKVIGVVPSLKSSKEWLKAGDAVDGLVPSDIANLAEQAGIMVKKISVFVENLDTTVKRINGELLDPVNMANIRTTVSNAASASSETNAAIKELKELLKTNRAAVEAAVANFSKLSTEMEHAAKNVDTLVTDNAPKVNAAVTNIEAASTDIRTISEKMKTAAEKVDTLLDNLKKGEGALGLLATDPAAKEDLKKLLENLSAFSENVRKRGILGYKDEIPRRPEPKKEDKNPATGKGGVIYKRPEPTPAPQPAPTPKP